jgi:hypothetical protein
MYIYDHAKGPTNGSNQTMFIDCLVDFSIFHGISLIDGDVSQNSVVRLFHRIHKPLFLVVSVDASFLSG